MMRDNVNSETRRLKKLWDLELSQKLCHIEEIPRASLSPFQIPILTNAYGVTKCGIEERYKMAGCIVVFFLNEMHRWQVNEE